MWILVETDSAPGPGNGGYAGALASHLPHLSEPDISTALPAAPGRPSFWRGIGYTGLCLVLAAGLIVQLGYRHLDRISQHEITRPWLLTLCETAGCELPTRQDSRLLISRRLSIGPHPEFQDISRLVLSFTNTADFSQPLPAIDLVFADITGRETAGRRFYPRDYFDTSTASPTVFALSAKESLSVQLDFATPAADAVNYQVRFVHE